jgi:hypothetical protein
MKFRSVLQIDPQVSLLDEINQKQSRPQDKPVPLDSLSVRSRALISSHYKQLMKNN